MKASFNWISSLVPGLSCTAEELAERFTFAGLEVEGMHAFGGGIESCVVAKVVSLRPHPTKSGLRLVTVDRGDGPREIVCGAPNVPEPGGLVVLAPLGTHLPAKNMTIEPRAIGGIVSEGMLCSEVELGIGDDASGILILPEGTAAPGTRLVDAVPATRDVIFDINLTPNRPDALGHIGLAREAAALFGLAWKLPTLVIPQTTSPEPIDSLVSLAIEDVERCPHYGAGAVLDVTIGPSPAWVRYRLASLGVRPISNVVDVTNLVMLEYGHPMHAFDLDLVRGKQIIVRRAREGEKLLTLDGIDRTLTEDDLVIADAEGATALAGVMGGGTSEISPMTKRVLLECAYFESRGIRRSARRHGLHTESSHRFERGIDHGDTQLALHRASQLVNELAGGAVARGAMILRKRKIERASVRLRGARLDQLLGVHVEIAEAEAILGRLGFTVARAADASLEAVVPTHRPDVSREVDLIEEVARVRGLDAIPTVLPALRPTSAASPREALARKARAAAVEIGLSEALIYGFTSPQSLAAVHAPPPVVVLKNPLSELYTVMRTSLLPGLAEAVSRAARRGEHDVRLFAVGARFLASRSESGLPDERLSFAAILAGERATWLGKPEPVDVWEAKGLALGLLARLTRREAKATLFPASERPAHLHPRGAAAVFLEGVQVGQLGVLHPDVTDALDVPAGALVVEIDLEAVAAVGVREPRFSPIPRFPASSRDIALVVSDAIAAGEVESVVREAAGALAEEVRLFDRFVGGSIPTGHASLAFHVVYRAPDRTLTDVEVDAQHAKVVSEVGTRFGATLR
jgi:phenylalanyl-tRNA synthetase beta chain